MAAQRRATAATTAVLFAALAGVATVWGLSAWWSYAEQTRGAAELGFTHPSVLPWMLDGLACALALVALAAALDGRPSTAARLGVAAALAGSIWSNRLGVVLRAPADRDSAVLLAAVAPVSAFLAFEVILSAIRRLVLRWRGLPAPVPIPALRPVRLLLAPIASVREWRAAVLAVTAPTLTPAGPAIPPGRAGGHDVDATAGSSSTPLPALPTAVGPAVDGGRVDALVPVHPPAPTGVQDSPVDSSVDDPGGPRVDSRLDSAVDAELDADRAPRRGIHRTRAGRPGGRRAGRPAGHSPDRPTPDWREVDWYAVAVARGISRSRAFQIIKAEPDAVSAAREQLRAMNGSAP